MNVSPRVECSAVPFSSSGDMTDRMVGSSMNSSKGNSEDFNKSSSPERDGDLHKISGPLADEISPKPEEDMKCAPVTTKMEHNPSGDKSDTKKRRTQKKWKKPKDKPSRPLSAYNLFFQAQRAAMLGEDAKLLQQEQGKGAKRVHRKTHGKIGFAEMARTIGQKWKDLPEGQKKPYLDDAAKEKRRYADELRAWKDLQKLKPKSGKSLIASLKAERKAAASEGTSSVAASDAKAIADESLKLRLMTEEINKRNMAILQQRSEADYLRALQERQMALLASRSSLDSSIFQYPSAAEASANAILQQFQYSMPGTLNSMSGMHPITTNMGMNPITSNMNMNSMGMNASNMNSLGSINLMAAAQTQFGAANRLQQFRGGLGANMGDFQTLGNFSGGSTNSANMLGAGQGDLDRLEQLASNEMAAAIARRLQNRFNM